jgi:carboxymethylenebutenolidase
VCVGDASRPPLPPIAGAAVDVRDLVVTAADGTSFAAVLARPEAIARDAGGGAGVLILPDWRGLHPFYEELALRFAEAGVTAIAIDLYGRTAGAAKRPPDFAFDEHFRQLTMDGLNADVAAALGVLRGERGGAVRTYTLGFCVGGRVSFLQAAEGRGLDGVIGLYGWPVGEHRSGLPAPLERVDDFSCPVLGVFAGDDYGISADDVATWERALADAGVRHETVVYPGTPHGFFDRLAEEHADASADAWRRVLAFIGAGESAQRSS